MRLLAVDTATRALSVALVEDAHLLAETTLDNRQTHAINLMRIIDALLKWSSLKVSDLDGLAVTHGPGSFTGLRIGISCVKGLAEACDLPVVAVSSLTVLARQVFQMVPLICPVLDARRKEVYFAFYRRQAGVLTQVVQPLAAPVTELVEMTAEKCLFVGNGSVRYRSQIQKGLGARAEFAVPEANVRRAATLAALGLERFKSGAAMDAADLKPYYLRRADAVLKNGAAG